MFMSKHTPLGCNKRGGKNRQTNKQTNSGFHLPSDLAFHYQDITLAPHLFPHLLKAVHNTYLLGL